MERPEPKEGEPHSQGPDVDSRRSPNPERERGQGAPGPGRSEGMQPKSEETGQPPADPKTEPRASGEEPGEAEPRKPERESQKPETGATFAEQIGDPGDMAEFDDLLESLRDAMQTADEARARAAAARPAARPPEPSRPREPSPPESSPLEEETEVPQAAADEGGDEYPEWLTNGSRTDEEEATGPQGGVEERFGMQRRRHVYRSYESSRISAHAFRCRVTLASNGHEFVGVADGPSVPGVRAEIAAKATLDALSSAENGRIVLSLMAARVLKFTDLPLVVVSVYGMADEEVNRLVGVSMVENSEEQAAIMATLQATDRWIAGVVGRYGAPEPSTPRPARDDW